MSMETQLILTKLEEIGRRVEVLEKKGARTRRPSAVAVQAGAAAAAARAEAFAQYVRKYNSIFPMTAEHDSPELRELLLEGRCAIRNRARYTMRKATEAERAAITAMGEALAAGVDVDADHTGLAEGIFGLAFAAFPKGSRIYFGRWAIGGESSEEALEKAVAGGMVKGILNKTPGIGKKVDIVPIGDLGIFEGAAPLKRREAKAAAAAAAPEEVSSSDSDDDDDDAKDAKGGGEGGEEGGDGGVAEQEDT